MEVVEANISYKKPTIAWPCSNQCVSFSWLVNANGHVYQILTFMTKRGKRYTHILLKYFLLSSKEKKSTLGMMDRN